MWDLDDLICHEILVATIGKIYVCWLGNNPPGNTGPDALIVLDRLFYDTLELRRKHPFFPKLPLPFPLNLTTIFAQVIK